MMPYIIAIAGKGGVGKTTVATLLIRYLMKIDRPILAIDADPNSNLNSSLGFGETLSISDIREEAKKLSSSSVSKSEFFNMRLQEIIAEGNGLDLLVMGRPEGAGCYCAVNNILREHLSKLSKAYKFVVVDNEAGMEHLSRRTADNIDKLLLVSDTTKVGIHSAIGAFNTAKKAELRVKDVSLLINKLKSPLVEEKLKLIKLSGLNIAGFIPFREDIEKDSEEGRKLLDIEIKDLDSVFDSIIGLHKMEKRNGKND